MVKNTKKLAPVLITAFNRDIHFFETLDALSKNKEAKLTNLYISIDGSISKEDKIKQEKIINFAKNYRDKFFSVKIYNQESNLGLAKNITQSISAIINDYGKIIVVEDDVVAARVFLKFMNDALDFYKKEKKIWHISGYNKFNYKDKKNEIFLWRLMNCWGWGTWADRWMHYEKDPKKIIDTFTEQQINDFNLGTTNIFWDQIIDNFENKINTWAIFWYATIFKNSGLCVNPWFSYIDNIGQDGTGTHYKKSLAKNLKQEINQDGIFFPVKDIKEDKNALKIMKYHYKKIN